jgi:cytidylate kinase
VLVCGSIASGKSSVAKEVSRVSRLPCLSFGDLIRQMAADQGSSDDREALQQLGHDLFERLGPEGMVDRLLSEVEGPAVIEGIRHLRVLDALQQRCEPCLVVFIEADRPTIERRFVDRAHHSDVTIDSGRALAHPVESEVEDLRARAGFILDTTETTIEEAARSVLSRVALSASMKSEAASGPATAPEVDRVVEMATKKIEDGIRAYLESLGKPAKPIVDKEAVKALKSEIRGTSDPIEKLRLLTALEDAEAGVIPDTSGDQAVFVAEAKAWAEAEGVSATAFQGLGVPDEILAEAGFEISPAARSTSNRSSGSGRAPRIPIEDVKAAVRKLGSGWKLSDLAAALDRDSATVRNYVNKLVKEGDITIVGDDPKHDGRGRAPKLYAAK